MEINQAILSFGLKYTGVAGQEYEMMSPVDNSEKLSRRMVLEEAATHSPMPLSAIEERLSGVRSELPEILNSSTFFLEKAVLQFFPFCHPVTLCRKSQKSLERSPSGQTMDNF